MQFSTTEYFFLAVFFLLLIVAFVCARAYHSLSQNNSDSVSETKSEIKTYRNVFYFFTFLVPLIYIAYFFTAKYHLESHVLEWLNLILRWAHVVFGIAWIGASFYFIFLENSLNRTENLRDELAGNLWAIHGGGFYYVEKYKSAPSEIPKTLHWFKYEAYFTWLTGMLLLTLVYFMNAKAVMVDASVREISSLAAILIGSGTMFFGWFIYDWMCNTSLLQKKKLFAVIGFLIVAAISFFLSKFLSGRAAFMLVGGLLGTVMAGNVFFCIIPSQKALLAAAKANQPVNPELGKIAGLRSLHNNYITLPVIFIMISNHFPTTFGNNFNWIILAGLTLASVAVRHFINLYEKGIYAKWMIPFATVAILALIIVTAPKRKKSAKELPPVSFIQVQPVIQKHCTSCHSSRPTDDVNKIAPNGIMFDTPQEVKKHADRILVRAVQTKTMPQGNKTGITEEERELIGVWIEQGAKIN
ncbi:MAG TPA: urate hydroxylase PuuD [Bacteroidia bacterium]|nr:urate hydroxylase PuuD [Bacteroidia bacterium]